MVYYRKYRPQTIAELDLEAVKTRLSSILTAKEIPHAFLFTGPKGLGKTSSARILAKAINCEKRTPKSIDPCNRCEACISITKGSNLDVIEIDAASNRGIDEIRDLREKIKYSPVSLSKKVYIIDEVHMLTTDAFNALLKTLEEPPDHAVFILCTTEADKVPATIASRTFKVEFRKPSKKEIVSSLERIIKGEKLDVDPEVIDQIFTLSEGSFRDAAKILEELQIGSMGVVIRKEILESTYKITTIDGEVKNLLKALSTKNLQQGLEVINELAQKGADFKVFTEKLALAIHELIILKSKSSPVIDEDIKFEISDLKKILESVNTSYSQIKFSVLPQIPLELVIVEYCIDQNTQVDIKSFEKTTETEKIKTATPITYEREVKEVFEKTEKKTEVTIKENDNVEQVIVADNPVHGDLFKQNSKPENFFALFLSKVKLDNHSIAGILRGCKLVGIDGGTVNFETRFKFHHDKLTDIKIGTFLDKRASEILAEKVHVVVNLVGK